MDCKEEEEEEKKKDIWRHEYANGGRIYGDCGFLVHGTVVFYGTGQYRQMVDEWRFLCRLERNESLVFFWMS